MVSELIHCDGCDCPVREKCGRFLPFIPPDNPVHWMDAPFEKDAGCCPDFQSLEIPSIQQEKIKWNEMLPTFGMI